MILILGEGNNMCECMCVLHKKQAYLEKILEKLQHNFCIGYFWLVFSWVIYEFLIHSPRYAKLSTVAMYQF